MIRNTRLLLALSASMALVLIVVEGVAPVSSTPPQPTPAPISVEPPLPDPVDEHILTPSESPSVAPALQLGPETPNDMWFEARVSGTENASWSVMLRHLSADESIHLEKIDERLSAVEVRGGIRGVLAEFQIGEIAKSAENTRIWARARGRRWSIWLQGRPIMAFETEREEGGRTGFHSADGEATLKYLSVHAVGDPAFSDDFMREESDVAWHGFGGIWEVAGLRFPERSANPFALHARFAGAGRIDPFIQRRWKSPSTGVGVNLSSWRGVVDIERITGNGSAAMAGIAEHDIVLSVDGNDYRAVRPFTFHDDLDGPEGSEVKLTMLRPGSLQPRSVTLKRKTYRWAEIGFGNPIPGSEPPAPSEIGRGGDSQSLAVAGRLWWDDYRFEASVCRIGEGGAGLAFGVRDRNDYHLFAAGSPDTPDRLLLARVGNGVRHTLAERNWSPASGTYYRMAVDLADGRIRAYVDGALVFDQIDSELPAGRIGLYAWRPERLDDAEGKSPKQTAEAYFDDVAVSRDRSTVHAAPDRRASALLAEEVDMRRWSNPSDEWVPDDVTDWWWEKFRFPGRTTLGVSPNAEYDRLEVLLGARRAVPGSGVLFTLAREANTLRISRAGKMLGELALGDIRERIAFVLDAQGLASAIVAGEEVLTAETLSPPDGDAVAIKGIENISSRGAVEASSDGVIEYSFREAPIDWVAAGGTWGVRNKWICDPRFSWFGGHSRSLAAIWNKRRLSGDVALDFYASLMMTSDDPPYERVGDFACTILGDGSSLSSGYTLIVSGGRNQWTRLYGGGRLLAESTDPADRLPSNVWSSPDRRALHQRWFRISLERTGGRVRALFEGREILSAPDTLGRETGYSALWTQDNGMLLGRVRLAAEQVHELAEDELRWSAPAGRQRIAGLTNVALEGISTRLSADGTGPTGETAVRVTNVGGGGPFACAREGMLNPNTKIGFHFRAEPGSHVDLYIEPDDFDPLAPGPDRIRLTGPKGERERHPVLDGPLAEDDGKWHRVEIDLDRLYKRRRSRQFGAAQYTAAPFRLVFACLEEGDGDEYLPAGFGANHIGSSYWVSDLRAETTNAGDTEPPRVRAILFPGEEGTPEGSVRIAFEDEGAGIEGDSILIALGPNGDVLPRSSEGGKSLTPSIADTRARRPFADISGRLGRRGEVLLRPRHRAYRFDAVSQTAELDLATALGASSLEGPLIVEVRAYADGAGNSGESKTRALVVDELVDINPPALGRLTFSPAVPGEIDVDFEPGFHAYGDLLTREGPDAPIMTLDTTTAVGGTASCRLVAEELASSMIFRVSDRPMDLARLRMLSFDYRIPDQTPVNLVARHAGGYYGVILSDSLDPASDWSRQLTYVGSFAGTRADGLWRRAELPLADMIHNAFPTKDSVRVHGLYLMDWGWNGLWPGDGWWIDNLRIEGVRRGATLAASWEAFDISGIAETAWAIDRYEDTIPKGDPSDATQAMGKRRVADLRESGALPDGEAWFHLRLRDGAGNWGATTHRRLFLDNTPPQVSWSQPADGEASARKLAEVKFDDYTGVDPTSIRLRVRIVSGEREGSEIRYAVDGRVCRFDNSTGILALDVHGLEPDRRLAPKDRVELEIVAVRDMVGNEMPFPHRWAWTYDPAVDTTPPTRPDIRITTCRQYEGYFDGPTFGETNDFERELGPVEGYRGCSVLLRSEEARYGNRSARIVTNNERRGAFSVRLRERYWFIDDRPYVTFSYRLPAQGPETLALRLDLLRGEADLQIFGPETETGLVADGQWHRAVFDIGRAAERSQIEFPVFRGEPYRLAGKILLIGRARPGTSIDLDDLEFVQRSWRRASVEIVPGSDISGIAGLSFVWDSIPDTVPPETIMQDLPSRLPQQPHRISVAEGLRQGKGYLHVRSCDGSGNWSETAHIRADFVGR